MRIVSEILFPAIHLLNYAQSKYIISFENGKVNMLDSNIPSPFHYSQSPGNCDCNLRLSIPDSLLSENLLMTSSFYVYVFQP